ncbi:hypothetical protein P168DRAFT_315689 [Aspergillus campestris IBT 28561]|uniref:Uncharacterized protein n=1 Tax=Aspergillus campestris (strain IBT 28561) TaxID=1392248 RepID=A0A2I1DBE3_ASPC2|nr:uncharacterized protein P168DRAFT_315689 [Aspergillus campestris IBT 28561]PKY07170.1 hypothetical protein P168DRAFT_315689 [Aspergillus campestris IBT 28561]
MAHKPRTVHNELRIPTVPNFPLSSPITEEVASPTGSSEDDRDLERNRPYAFLAKVSDRNPFARQAEIDAGDGRRSTVGLAQESPRENSLTSGGRKKGAEKPVGLNLVTDFSSAGSTKRGGGKAPAFLDLNDLKVLSERRENERKVKGILKNGANQESALLTGQSRDGSAWRGIKSKMSPRKNKKDELSPSDRPIMIGFTLPADESGEQRERTKELDSADGLRTPLTPSIVVTPAKEEGFWRSLRPQDQRPRATSSVYSQPTPLLETSGLGIPPVPAIPAHHTASGLEATSPELSQRRSIASVRRQRAYSTGTVFEDDDSPRTGRRSRSYSNESAKKAFHRLTATRHSATSEVNKHYSQGWWTYLLSPILGRSNTMTSRRTPTTTERPPIPTIATDVTGSSDDEWWEKEKEISCFSPETPETAVANRGEVMSWEKNDWNPFSDFDSSNVSKAETPAANTPGAGGFMGLGETVQGEAAEYYQASAHELFSRRPYFECINHVCSITPKDAIPGFAAGSLDSPGSNERNLLVDVDDSISQAGHKDRGLVIPPAAAVVAQPEPTVVDGKSSAGSETAKSPEQPKDGDSPRETSREVPGAASPVPEVSRAGHSPPLAEHMSEKQGHPVPLALTTDTAQLVQPFPSAQPVQPFPLTQPVQAPVDHIYPQMQPTQPAQPVYIQPAPGFYQAPGQHPGPQYIVVAPPYHQAQPQAPDPISPGFQRQTEGDRSIPLGEMPTGPAPAYISRHGTPVSLPPRPGPHSITRETTTTHSTTEQDRIESRRQRHEKEDAAGKKAGGLWRGRGPVSKKGCFGRSGREGRLKRRWYMVIAFLFVLIVLASLLLAILLTRKGDATPIQSQWLNLTGYPPMPTGIATIAGPEAHKQDSGCITPSALWSCALPNEQHETNKPYAADEPNFRVEIRFRNGTYPNSTTVASSPSDRLRSRGTAELFNPSPLPPSLKDQAFVGNTTDGNSAPFAGEETPFFITLLSTTQPKSQLSRRDSNTTHGADDDNKNDDNENDDKKEDDTNPFPDIDTLIPSPSTDPDGTAASATLYPLPSSQPIRLYNRGQDTEHYGFYTYFDRSIFLDSIAVLTGSKNDTDSDSPGGPSKADARVRCTWSQTRFLVQIWTKPSKGHLLDRSPSPSSSARPSTTTSHTSPSSSSSATDFSRPGSFPYPVTITLDRHGGNAASKMVYCYGMETAQHVNATEKKLQIEDRAFGGELVNPAPGIFNLNSTAAKGKDGAKGKGEDLLKGFWS